MSKINEKQAKSILSYLTIRFLKSMKAEIYAKIDLNTYGVIRYSDSLIIATTSKHNIFSMPIFLLYAQEHASTTQRLIDVKNYLFCTNKQILEVLLHWTSIGYDIVSTYHIFLPAYFTLEQLLIEKDLEENIIA